MKWFRFHSDVIHDPKVLRLPTKLRWRWVELLCLANQQEDRGTLPPLEDIALMLRVPERDVVASLEALSNVGLIDIGTERVRPHNWDKWQPASDNAAERMANKRRTRSEQVPAREEENRTEEKRLDPEEEADAENAPAHPFTLTYVRRFQERHAGQRPPQTEHAACLALEREFGPGPCIELGNDLDWQKHPNYMRPILKERINGNANRANHGVPAASANPDGVAGGLSDMERRRAFVARRG